MSEPTLPLNGVRVLDVGTRIAAPFCAGILAEQGAEVIKIEQPGTGDFLRSLGPFHDGYSLFWAVEGRSRKSVTLDLRQPQGQALFRSLAGTVDIVCENFRPGTMERWSIGPADLDPRLVMVRISAYGQDGPNAELPGQDLLGISFGGLLNLCGEADRPPVKPTITLSDHLTAIFAAQAAVALLYARDRDEGGTGGVVDASLYGAVLRVLEWTIPHHDRTGGTRAREGNTVATAAPLGVFESGDERFVSVVAASDPHFRLLCSLLEMPGVLADPRFSTARARAEHRDLANGFLAEWVAQRSAATAVDELRAAGVPSALVQTADDIVADPHIRARGDLVAVDDPVLGSLLQQAPYPRLNGTTPIPTGAPLLGAHNTEVYCDLLGLTEREVDDLTCRGII